MPSTAKPLRLWARIATKQPMSLLNYKGCTRFLKRDIFLAIFVRILLTKPWHAFSAWATPRGHHDSNPRRLNTQRNIVFQKGRWRIWSTSTPLRQALTLTKEFSSPRYGRGSAANTIRSIARLRRGGFHWCYTDQGAAFVCQSLGRGDTPHPTA